MDSIFNRIKAIIDHYGFTPSGFEKQCGLSCGTITAPLRLNKGIGYRALSRICATSHVNVAWLYNGTQPVFICECFSDHIVETLFKNGKTISEFEIATGNPKHSFQKEAVLRTMSKSRATVWAEELQKYLPEADYSWLEQYNNSNIPVGPIYYKILPGAGESTAISVTLNPEDSLYQIGSNFYFVREEEDSSQFRWNKEYILELPTGTIVCRVISLENDKFICYEQKDSGLLERVYISDIRKRLLILATFVPQYK